MQASAPAICGKAATSLGKAATSLGEAHFICAERNFIRGIAATIKKRREQVCSRLFWNQYSKMTSRPVLEDS